jgi:hypothetical protein
LQPAQKLIRVLENLIVTLVARLLVGLAKCNDAHAGLIISQAIASVNSTIGMHVALQCFKRLGQVRLIKFDSVPQRSRYREGRYP